MLIKQQIYMILIFIHHWLGSASRQGGQRVKVAIFLFLKLYFPGSGAATQLQVKIQHQHIIIDDGHFSIT